MAPGALHPGLERLGLERDAEARDIRRAYARELKKIDQARDAAGFQQLRDAYEGALAFAQWQADQGDPAPAPTPAPAPPVLPVLLQANPEELADAAANDFCAALPQLARQHDEAAPAPWEAALQQALLDERLFNIDARHGFELRVAIVLVNGWRPGHEALLTAATAIFHWARGTQLAALGQAGLMLQRALDERALFDSQGPSTIDAQRRVLALLRQESPSRDAQIQQGKPAFERMHARFPGWLAIVAPRESVLHWHARSQQVTIIDNTARVKPAPPAPKKSRWLKPLLAVFFCVLALGIFLDKPAHRNPPGPGVMVQSPPPQAPPAAPDVPVTRARLDEILSRIDYTPAKGEKNIARAVSFQVFLDVDGKAFGANLVASSGLPGLDAAVKTAILTSKPFPPNTEKIFRMVAEFRPAVRSKRPQ